MGQSAEGIGSETRRATDRHGELTGAGLSALMAVLFAVVVILGKQVQAGELPFVMLAIRFVGQSAILFGFVSLLGRPWLPARGERLALALAGTVGYGSEAAFYFAALNHGSAAAVTLLFYTYPVWVMLATIALDRKGPPAMLFVALTLAVAGSVFVVLGGGSADITTIGILLALCTSVAYTAYLIGTDRHVRRTDPLTAAAWLGLGAAGANVVYALVFSAVTFPAASSWWRLLGMMVASSAAFAAMLGGLQRVGAVRNAIIGVMEPLTVAVLAYFLLDEPITSAVAIGGTLILGAAVIASVIRTTATVEPNV
jgi:drug/metabolite transporter (DMT)-like permease